MGDEHLTNGRERLFSHLVKDSDDTDKTNTDKIPISSIPRIPSLDDSSSLSEELNDKSLRDFAKSELKDKSSSHNTGPIEMIDIELPSFYADECICKSTALILDNEMHSLKTIVEDLD